MFFRRPHRSFPVEALLSALPCVLSWALAGCSNDSTPSSDSSNPPHVFIDAVFTTEPDSNQSIARPPDRQPLGTVKLPCDGFLAVRLAYDERWGSRAPGLCGEAINCGHAALKLSLADLTSETMVVASPALFALGTEPSRWDGVATLEVELRKDDGAPYLVDDMPIRDQIEVPLAPQACAAP